MQKNEIKEAQKELEISALLKQACDCAERKGQEAKQQIIQQELNNINGKIFSYFGIYERDINTSNIEKKLQTDIANEQNQFSNGITYVAENIQINKFAYVEATPNRLLVFAKWAQKINC
jgi:hypothetical protein